MKVCVITRHAITNYGSLLQTYATQTVLEQLGAEAEIIDYIRTDEQYKNITKTLVKKTGLWNKNSLTRWIYTHIQNLTYVSAGKKFEQMQRERLHLTKLYSSYEELQNDPPKADVFCTGSDQVWGPIGDDALDKTYFLEFAKDKRCISYAASFGRVNQNKENLDQIRDWLGKYEVLALREDSAVEMVKKMGVTNVEQVLDPTLLLNADAWNKIASKQRKQQEYVLIYQLHRNKEMDAYAKEFAKKAGLPLIRVTPMFYHLFRNGKKVYLPDVSEFLAYIRDAKYIITDSFHGTVFSINYNKQFIEILPGETATRNQSILQLLHLEDRVIRDYNDFSLMQKQIDYTKVMPILEENRKDSIAVLEKALRGGELNE